jgi:hypothetical protein
MSINFKRIIREELSRVLEGDVVHVKFGGGGSPTEKPMSAFHRILGEVDKLLTDALNEEGPDMDDEDVVKLEKVMHMVHDLQSGNRPVRGPKRVGAATGREREELSRFNQYMRDSDEESDY